MSDDMVARLRRSRRVWVNGDAMTIIDIDSAYKDFHDAADLIEQLTAERDTLAEIVRLLNVSTGPYAGGGTVWRLIADDWFDYALTPERGQRFQRVLDRITKEASDGE